MTPVPTTERIVVDDYQSSEESCLLYFIHLATYNYCVQYVSGKRVLDFGCGSGYGTAMIGSHCSAITGIDTSPDAIHYARDHYVSANLTFMLVDPVEKRELPFRDRSFDVVLSLQVIEHVRDVDAYLKEIVRVLVPGGCAVIATPDRHLRLHSFQKPWNVWHLREYSREQLRKTLEAHFPNVIVRQLGGEAVAIRVEVRRITRLKWLTLPFTLPFLPDSVRMSFLRAAKRIGSMLVPRSRARTVPEFDATALRISDNEQSGVDLVATAYTQDGIDV
jgi:SAM-dependent methyltransferase